MEQNNDNNHCQCDVCLKCGEFEKHIKNVNDKETAQWFCNLFEHLNNVENDLDAHKIYDKNLRTLYPKIWKEVTTIRPLSKDDAQFPEIQLK
jgi:hypothetical protein